MINRNVNFLITITILLILSFSKDVFCQTIICNNKQVAGRIETIILADENIALEAKLDSGATMASLSAENIQTFKKNNQVWIKFSILLPNSAQKITLIKPLDRYIHILKRTEEDETNQDNYAIRPVVNLPLCIGDRKITLQVNLIDRSAFKYPLLLGTDALKKFNILIDVSKDHLIQTNCH